MSEPEVLYVDGDRNRAGSVSTFLAHRKPSILVETVHEFDEALGLLAQRSFDCIVSCAELPGGDGLELLEVAKDEQPETPFVLAAADGDEQLASRAVSAGADDYHVHDTDRTEELASSIDGLLAEAAVDQPNFDSRVLEELLAHIPDTVYIKDTGGRFLKTSESKAREAGTSRHELRGQSDFDHFDHETAEEMYVDEQRIVETGEPVISKTEEIETASGETRWVSATKIPRHHDGEVVGTLGISRDITQRQRYLRMINDLHDMAERLLRADSVQGVCEVALETAASTLHFQATAHVVSGDDGLGTAAETGEFGSAVDLSAVDDPCREALEAAIETWEPVFLESIDDDMILEGHGRIRSIMALPLGPHGALCLCCTEVDSFNQHRKDAARILASNARAALDRIDRRQRLEQKERETERLERFSEEVSHDLRSPLSVASGNVELALEEYDSEELQRASQALDQVDAIVDEMLDLAKRGELVSQTETVSLCDVVDIAWDHVKTKHATLEPPETEVELEADRVRLTSAFENLFRNSVEHGHPEEIPAHLGHGGDVGSSGLTVEVNWLGDGFAVVDNGPGIDPAVADGIFERGVSSDEDGTGYGLAIVEDIVTAHGWEISADTDADGARFVVSGVDAVEE